MLLPPENSTHNWGPLAAVINQATKLEQEGKVVHAGVYPVQPWMDTAEVASSVVVVTNGDADSAQRYARWLGAAFWARRREFVTELVLPDYEKETEVCVDVITLDSASCAPCQYMMEAVENAANKAMVKVWINEHKIKVREGIGVMVKLGVRNLPTICIDGEVAFASIIPDQKSLVALIILRGCAQAR